MASAFSHAVAALSIGTCFYGHGMPKRVWLAGALCSVLPDIDVIGFHFGIHYGDFWGHRGFTHSLLFAAILATLVGILGFSRVSASPGILWVWSYLFLATARRPINMLPNGEAREGFREMARSNARFARYEEETLLEEAVLIELDGKLEFLHPHQDTDWDFARLMSFLNDVLKECLKPLWHS